MRWPRSAGRRPSTSASSTSAGSATSPATPTPIRVLNPIAAPHSVMRSSLVGSLVDVLRVNLARKRRACACSRSARCSCATPARRRPARRRRRAPAAAARRPRLRPGRRRRNGASRERAVDFFDVKGDVEALLAPRRRALRRRAASGAASRAAARAIELDGERDRHRRRAASALAPGLRAAGSAGRCSSSTPRRCCAARCRRFAPMPQPAVGVARHRGRRRPTTSRHEALIGRDRRRRPSGWCASATLFDIYRAQAARRGRHRRRRAQPGGAARDAATTSAR